MEQLVEFLLYQQGIGPYFIAFSILLACGLGLPLPEDIILFAMGLLSYYGLTDLTVSIVVCLLGVLIGDCMIYYFGLYYGKKLTKQGPFKKFLTPERLKQTKNMFHKWGNKVILAARFMPGLRSPTFFSAGTLHLPFRVFIFYDGLAALLSVPLLIGVAFYFGDHVDRAIQLSRKVQHGIILLILGVVLVFVLKYFLRSRYRK